MEDKCKMPGCTEQAYFIMHCCVCLMCEKHANNHGHKKVIEYLDPTSTDGETYENIIPVEKE